MQAEFYLDKLYPLQDQVLSDLTRLESKFYLSGGTTISRCYTNHRYSDDLDFFMNSASIFKSETERVLDFLKKNYELEIVNQYEDFVRIQIVFSNFSLKVDFINDIPFHAGEIIHHPLYHKIDSIENILSNKLSALTRGEPKDISDIIALSCFTNFDWRQLIDDAKKKDAWVNEIDIAILLDNYDVSKLKLIKWVKLPDFAILEKVLKQLAKDILNGNRNSMAGVSF